MIHIKFRYKDEYSNGEWREQECVVDNLQQCIELYGLNECEYEIIEIKEM